MEKLPEFENSSWGGGGGLFSFSEENDDGEITGNIKEELIEEVMQELRKEISSCYGDDCYKNTLPEPASLPVYYPPSPAFVVVGGDNERCGPAVSGSTASMMVGIGVVGSSVMVAGGVGGSGEVGVAEVAGNGSRVVEGEEGFMQGGGGGEKMDGCDEGESEDEWLTRVLSWGPQEFADFDQFDLSLEEEQL